MFLSKDDKLKTSPVFFGYLILKELQDAKDSKITILDIMERIKNEFEFVHYHQILFALIFAHYIEIKIVENTKVKGAGLSAGIFKCIVYPIVVPGRGLKKS